MYPSKIIVLKGITVEKPKKWERVELTIEMILEKGDDPKQAKATCDVLLEAWLKKEAKL